MMFPNTKLNSKAPSFPTTSPSNSSVSRSALSGTLSSSPPLFLSKIDLLAQMAEFQTTGTSPNYTTNSSTSSDYFHQNNFLTNNFSSRTLDTTSTTTKQSLMSSSFSSIDNIGKTKSERASFSSSIETLNNHSFCSSADSNEALYKLDLEFGTGDFSLPDFSESPLLQPASVDHDSPVPVVGCVNAGWCLDSNTSSSANRVILPPPTILVPSATSTTESSPVQEYTEQSIFSSPGLLPQIAISSSPILLPDEKQLQARAEEIKRLEQAKIEAESTALAFNQTVKEIMSNNDNADYRKKSLPWYPCVHSTLITTWTAYHCQFSMLFVSHRGVPLLCLLKTKMSDSATWTRSFPLTSWKARPIPFILSLSIPSSKMRPLTNWTKRKISNRADFLSVSKALAALRSPFQAIANHRGS